MGGAEPVLVGLAVEEQLPDPPSGDPGSATRPAARGRVPVRTILATIGLVLATVRSCS